MEKDQAFVLMVIKEIVEHPDDVKVDRKVDEMGVLLTLTVNPEDMGKIIGKEGRTAKAVRTLLRVLGARQNARVNLKIEEPEGSTYVPPANDLNASTDDVASTSATSADDVTPVVATTDDNNSSTTMNDSWSTSSAPAPSEPEEESPT